MPVLDDEETAVLADAARQLTDPELAAVYRTALDEFDTVLNDDTPGDGMYIVAVHVRVLEDEMTRRGITGCPVCKCPDGHAGWCYRTRREVETVNLPG